MHFILKTEFCWFGYDIAERVGCRSVLATEDKRPETEVAAVVNRKSQIVNIWTEDVIPKGLYA